MNGKTDGEVPVTFGDGARDDVASLVASADDEAGAGWVRPMTVDLAWFVGRMWENLPRHPLAARALRYENPHRNAGFGDGRNCSVRKPGVDGGAGGRGRLTRNSARRADVTGTNKTPAVWPVPKGTAQGPFRGLRALWWRARSPMTSPRRQLSPSDLERLFSTERLSTYLAHCDGDFAAAVEMYRWNSAITAAFWEPIGHLEVALRNTLDDRLAVRHRRLR
jgi:hypothetical protein